MQETRTVYTQDLRVTIISQRSIHNGKTGTIRGIFCVGLPDREQYVVHIDGDHDSTRVYHFFPDEIEPVVATRGEIANYR